MSTQALMTADEFATMQFDQPVELVRGEVVELNRPGMLHGVVCLNVAAKLHAWAKETDFGPVIGNDSGVITATDPDTVRGPDVYVIRQSRLVSGELSRGWLSVPPDLVVEVLSPSDRWSEVHLKIAEYLSFGVPLVWVVDPDQRCVHQFRPDTTPDRLDETDSINGGDVLSGFECPVADFFP